MDCWDRWLFIGVELCSAFLFVHGYTFVCGRCVRLIPRRPGALSGKDIHIMCLFIKCCQDMPMSCSVSPISGTRSVETLFGLKHPVTNQKPCLPINCYRELRLVHDSSLDIVGSFRSG